MYRKINIKLLAVVFVVLLVLAVLVEMIDIRKGSRTFKQDLVEVNADEVTSIEVDAKSAGGKPVILKKENDVWKVEANGKTYRADQSVAGSMMSQLNGMKSKSLATTDKDRWKEFEVTDSLGTRVKLFKGSDLLADVIFGKFSYSQPQTMTSYVRMADENEVYGVDGMMGMSFNRNANSFRDKTLLSSTSSNWNKLTFTYPADSSFTLEKVNDKWMIGSVTADSTSVAKYFQSITRLYDSKFAENDPAGQPTHRLKIEGNNNMEPLEINGYYTDAENFVLGTSQNKGTWFNDPTTATKLFIPAERFLNK
ncbi:MAG: DUF4340 domain-containing protein [Desulfobacter sp.]|nr:DUF4340 domain-containing protein [Desulfobacter sp.]